MKVFIKDVENGWLVHYDVIGSYDDDYKKVGEKEKAFTYDFQDEKVNAWRRLEWFILNEFDWELCKKINLQMYDEEKQEWVSNQELKRRENEKDRMKTLKEWDQTHKPADPRDFTKREIKRMKEIDKGWDEERAADMTSETWQIQCTESIFDDLQRHFAENKNMNYEEYVEIKNAAVRKFTKRFGLQPNKS